MIEHEIAVSDPGLASLLAAFARLAAGEELPAREHGRRRHLPLPRTSRRAGEPAVHRGLAAVLLWVTVSVAPIVSALVISAGDHWKGWNNE